MSNRWESLPDGYGLSLDGRRAVRSQSPDSQDSAVSKTRRPSSSPPMTEAQLQDAVITAAELWGWRWHHETDSRRTRPGWPDLLLVRDGLCLVLEMKSATGRVTEEQAEWIEALGAVDGITAAVIRPNSLDAVARVLAGQAAPDTLTS